MTISNSQLIEIQGRYADLLNYQSDDPTTPIDPLTYVDSNGDSLLHIASQRGDLVTVSLLLDEGVNANLRGDMGNTPLHYAKSKEIANALLEKGASSDLKNEFGEKPPWVGKPA